MEYNNKVPAPCEHRIATAFNRMCHPGGFYEVQLIGLASNPDVQNCPMYQVFQNANLDSSATLTIKRKSAKVALVRWHDNDTHERDELNTKLHKMLQDIWLTVPITARTSDAEILYAAASAYRDETSKAIRVLVP